MKLRDIVTGEAGLGSTGVPPVPAGVPPVGLQGASTRCSMFASRLVDDSAGRRAEQAGRPCYPSRNSAPTIYHIGLGLVLLFLFAALPAFAGPVAFKEATDLYEKQDYQGARERYEKLLEDGILSANIFYDLGNTAYRLKRPGDAALAYQRALMLEPRHPEAAANLALLRAQAGAKALPASPVEPLLLPLPAPVYFSVGALAFWGAVLSGAALLLWRSTPRILVLVCVASVLVAAYAGLGLWRFARDQATAVVLVPEAIARLDAADRAGIAETLPAGSDVRVLSEHGDWIYCELPGGGRGWLPRKSIEKVAHST